MTQAGPNDHERTGRPEPVRTQPPTIPVPIVEAGWRPRGRNDRPDTSGRAEKQRTCAGENCSADITGRPITFSRCTRCTITGLYLEGSRGYKKPNEPERPVERVHIRTTVQAQRPLCPNCGIPLTRKHPTEPRACISCGYEDYDTWNPQKPQTA